MWKRYARIFSWPPIPTQLCFFLFEMFFLILRCFAFSSPCYNAGSTYIQLAAVEGGYDSLVQLSILSSCSFDSCLWWHHVDSTYPRGPFGFVQLLLLCCPGWWSVRVLQQRRRARAHIIFYTQHGLNECTRDSWCRKGKRSSSAAAATLLLLLLLCCQWVYAVVMLFSTLEGASCGECKA